MLSNRPIRYLSYSPLTAPSRAASTMNQIHRLCWKSMPSFLPERLSRKNETMASNTPIHWYRFRRSPNISKAPTRVMTGRVALIGPTMVSGRCFIPKYPKVHEERTMTDFRRMYRCTSHPASGTKKMVCCNHSGRKWEMRMNGRNIRLEKRVFSPSTGSTALPANDFFLNTS